MKMNLDLLTLFLTSAIFITQKGNLIRHEVEGEPECIPLNGPDTENSPEALFR